MQGRHHEAAQFYEDAAGVDVPDRTHTLKNPLEARAALRRGDRSRAFEMLRSYIDELLDNDNVYVGKFACIEFVRMMVKVDRRPEAARILGFLESTGSLDVSSPQITRRGRRPKDRGRLSNTTRTTNGAIGRDLDDRRALTFIRDVLDRLVDSEQRSTRPSMEAVADPS